MAALAAHCHGKRRVDVCRVWRGGPGGVSEVREWSVDVTLHSAMERAYTEGDNAGMTATDTMKNTVFQVAKAQARPCSPEEFATALARLFVAKYPLVSVSEVRVRQKAWTRAAEGSHVHGFVAGVGTRMADAVAKRVPGGVDATVTSGVAGVDLLKTTQSGYEGYIKDDATSLPETRERMLGTTLSATWTCRGTVSDYDRVYDRVMNALVSTFFGPPATGVYSPSVQYTLFQMGKAALEAVPALAEVELQLPNLHYLPTPPLTPFADDVYVVAPNPHGSIRATVARSGVPPRSRM